MQRNNTPLVSCVVPVFNEGDVVADFLTALIEQLNVVAPRFEIILVDDGSQDNTAARVQPFCDSGAVKLISLSRNFGKEAALTAGIDACLGDAVILIDADFQHPLAMIPVFLDYWEKGYEMIYGIRRDRTEESFLKRKGAQFFYGMMRFGTGVDIPAHAGDFRLLDRKVVDALKQLPERERFMKGIYAWVGFKSLGIPFDVQERAAGDSRWCYGKLTNLALSGLTSFSTLPLRLVGLLGLLISAAAVFYALFIIFTTLVLGNTVPGWPTVVTAITFIGGIQLLSLGVLGEYIAGIFNEVKQRPIYLVQQRQGFTQEKDNAPTH